MISRLFRARPIRRILVAGLLLLTAAILAAARTSAHPLGNFTINQYVRIEVTESGHRIVYVLDMAEVPAFQEIQRFDVDHDGEVGLAERDAYLKRLLRDIAAHLSLTLDGEDLALRPVEAALSFPDGQAGLSLLRVEASFVPDRATVPTGDEQRLEFRNAYLSDRLGWREIVVTHGPGIELMGIDLPSADASRELTAYPDDLLRSPLDQTAVSFRLRHVPGAAPAASFAAFQAGVAAGEAPANRPDGGTSGSRFAALVNGGELSRTGIALALLAAMLWGAAHALSPGHGKTVVAAYLIGSRGTARHAIVLGLTVTFTHTAGVIALGLVTLFASRYVVPETLFPWLSVASGAMVVVMGLWTLKVRLRGEPAFGHHHHHDHDHPHDHDHGDAGHTHTHGEHTHSHLPPSTITWRGLLALGVSGGLIPCPSALLALLGAVALGRASFGVALVTAFSLGLAATLTGLGFVFLYAGQLLERRIAGGGRLRLVLRFAPALGSAVLTMAGVAIVVKALAETGLR